MAWESRYVLTLRYSLLLLFLFRGKGNPDLAYVFQHCAGPFLAQPVLEMHIVYTYTC